MPMYVLIITYGCCRPILVLPPADVQVIYCGLTDAEKDFYEALFKRSKVTQGCLRKYVILVFVWVIALHDMLSKKNRWNLTNLLSKDVSFTIMHQYWSYFYVFANVVIIPFLWWGAFPSSLSSLTFFLPQFLHWSSDCNDAEVSGNWESCRPLE